MTAPRLSQCVHCDGEFDPVEKLTLAKRERRNAGKANECIDCATVGPAKYTGVMVYGHKTAGAIQINQDPRITEYMLKASPSSGSNFALGQNMPHTKEGVVVQVAEVAKRRE